MRRKTIADIPRGALTEIGWNLVAELMKGLDDGTALRHPFSRRALEVGVMRFRPDMRGYVSKPIRAALAGRVRRRPGGPSKPFGGRLAKRSRSFSRGGAL